MDKILAPRADESLFPGLRLLQQPQVQRAEPEGIWLRLEREPARVSGMTTVVLDTHTVSSAIFWPQSTARRCLTGLARRWDAVAVTAKVFAEYEAVVAEFHPLFSACNSAGEAEAMAGALVTDPVLLVLNPARPEPPPCEDLDPP